MALYKFRIIIIIIMRTATTQAWRRESSPSKTSKLIPLELLWRKNWWS